MVVGGFGWFWLIPCFSNYAMITPVQSISVFLFFLFVSSNYWLIYSNYAK